MAAASIRARPIVRSVFAMKFMFAHICDPAVGSDSKTKRWPIEFYEPPHITIYLPREPVEREPPPPLMPPEREPEPNDEPEPNEEPNDEPRPCEP